MLTIKCTHKLQGLTSYRVVKVQIMSENAANKTKTQKQSQRTFQISVTKQIIGKFRNKTEEHW